MKAAKRIKKLRTLMSAKGLDACIVRSTTDLMWLTAFSGVFDAELAHTALITPDTLVMHTDSRYACAMRQAAAEEGLWSIDDAPQTGPSDFVALWALELGIAHGRIGIDEMVPLKLYRAYIDKLPDAEFVETSKLILNLRAQKEPAEIELMRRAQAIAESAFKQTISCLRPGLTEREVSLQLEYTMLNAGADELAFPNIVASGPNSSKAHAVPSERVIERGDLVVFDFGARKDGYRSDTTRTVSIGKPSDCQRRIYDAVFLANADVAAAICPGVTGAEMHELALSVLADAGFGGCMGHGLGHGVGLDIHEEPMLSPKNAEPLVAGNVVTDEPGVYIAGQNGVRIEDLGVVSDEGFESLCTLSHELIVIE